MDTERDNRSGAVSRRAFLGALGTGAVASGTPGILGRPAEAQALRHGGRPGLREDRFTRLFPRLAPFASPSDGLAEALLELGKPGGILDAHDALDRGPVDLIVDPALSEDNPNNPTHTAGTTFMGQFMDHDLTFDLASRLFVPTDPEDSPNERTPGFDLDSVYARGPLADPSLYERGGRGGSRFPTRFKVESGGLFEDLPRTADGVAIIADPRNDENLVIAGLHAAILLFHNQAVDLVAAGRRRDDPEEVFRRARRLTTWHYQWMILHEFLPLFVGRQMVDDILSRGRHFYRPDVALIPVEFQGAAFRFGHSMVRPSYRANLAGDAGQAFFGLVFDPSQEGEADPGDLRGGSRAPRRFIGWQTFFDFGDGQVRPNKLIDTRLSTPLFNLPLGAIAGPPGGPTSLPQRNLLRHVTWQLPSGQSLARIMNVPALSRADLGELKDLGHGLDESTPLWYYILKEAEVMEGGLHLGPVGGRIVGEVIIGLLQLDRTSFLSDPRWRPTLPDRHGRHTGDFRMVDFLTFAGVDPTTRGQ
jgi:hypothetical protein